MFGSYVRDLCGPASRLGPFYYADGKIITKVDVRPWIFYIAFWSLVTLFSNKAQTRRSNYYIHKKMAHETTFSFSCYYFHKLSIECINKYREIGKKTFFSIDLCWIDSCCGISSLKTRQFQTIESKTLSVQRESINLICLLVGHAKFNPPIRQHSPFSTQ